VEIYLMAYPLTRFRGVVQGVGWALYDQNQGSNGVLPTVSPTLDWVRLAQRFPVRIVMDASPDAEAKPYRMGQTATAIVQTRLRREVPDILKPLLPDAMERWLDTLGTRPEPTPFSPGRAQP
jgi:multidrug resistance efflux pump